MIYERFFRRIVEVYCPPERTHKEFMEDLFDIDHRHITSYTARRPFEMPGLLVLSGNVKVQGVGYRMVSLGANVLVRTDSRNPAEVHVDFFAGQGNAEHVYSLTRDQWSSIQKFLVSEEDDGIQPGDQTKAS